MMLTWEDLILVSDIRYFDKNYWQKKRAILTLQVNAYDNLVFTPPVKELFIMFIRTCK